MSRIQVFALFLLAMATDCTAASVGPVEKRQQDGGNGAISDTDRYECHETCGLSIQPTEDDHCNNSIWRDRLDSCLLCVNEYDIWPYYSSAITTVAADCNLVVEPGSTAVGSDPTAAATSSGPPSSTTSQPAATGTPDNSPPSDEFLRRMFGTVAVIGDRIYYEGGEVSQKGYNGWRHSNPLNTTLSIDLSSSWFPANVSISETARPDDAPAMKTQAVLVDTKSKALYGWGGSPVWIDNALSPPRLWRFDVEDDSWSEAEPASVDTFRSLERTGYAAFASAPNAGFVFGGRKTSGTAGEGTESSNPQKYVSFDFESMEWEEHEDPPYSVDGTLWGGRALYVPDFGPNGLIFILGGMRGRDETEPSYISFEDLHFLDPVTGTWYNQRATEVDRFPQARHEHCVVGVSGANGTYDIFVFGGSNDDARTDSSAIYILSLPSFTWSLAHVPPAGHSREGPACAVVGKSQLLTWGGLSFPAQQDNWGEEDVFPQGLGIFDMNELEWKTEYNPDADAYRAPDRIASRRKTSVEWSSPEVSALFAQSNPDPQPSPSPSPSGEPGGGSSTPVGAIAGGVVGGVVAIAVAAAAVWFFCIRKRKEPGAGAAEVEGSSSNQFGGKPELESNQAPSELHAYSPPVEMGEQGAYKPAPQVVHEMDGSNYR